MSTCTPEALADWTTERANLRARRASKVDVLNIILPTVQAMMCGVWRIRRAHELTCLDYTDGTTESATIPLARWRAIAENPFSIVGEVQSHRRKE